MVDSEQESTQKQTETQKRKKRSVLKQSFGGGPHGLGDPDDKSLRKVESDIVILEKIRYLSRTLKCADFVKAFAECSKEAGLLVPLKCREENTKLRECLRFWFENEEFKEQCKEEYLRDRSEYRRTGIPPKRLDRKTKIWAENPEYTKLFNSKTENP